MLRENSVGFLRRLHTTLTLLILGGVEKNSMFSYFAVVETVAAAGFESEAVANTIFAAASDGG